MLKIQEYVRAESLEQAYELNQKRSSRVLGGMLWMNMSSRSIQKAIDLSGLGLDTIEETDEGFSIGCMATLRQLEVHPGLERWTGGAVRESVRSIVGVQFRNLATVGGSIFGRFGFSDVLTCFMALDSYVELYRGGVVSLEDFARMEPDSDILVRLLVKKTPGLRTVYLSHRNTRTDFPVLTCAVSFDERGGRAVVGARPGRAVCIPLGQEAPGTQRGELAQALAKQIPMGSNMRASAEYRSHLAGVLLERGLRQLTEKEGREDL